MSSVEEVVGDILEHHGIKGMKWGVQRSNTTGTGLSRRERRANAKFEKRASSLDTKIKLNNAVTKAMNDHITRINAKYDAKYKKQVENGVLLDRNSPITKAYHKEYNDAALKELNNVASSMTNKSGTRQYKAVPNQDDFLGFTVIAVDVKHADQNTIHFIYEKDDMGRIIGINVDGDMMHSDILNNILEHHGTKGMKWGVRRSRESKVTVTDKRRSVKTSGGHGRPAHPDAVRARTIGQVSKKSGLKALSNEELQAYNQRLNLEQQAKRLSFNDKSPPKKFVLTLLGRTGNTQATEAANTVASKQVKRVLTRAALA